MQNDPNKKDNPQFDEKHQQQQGQHQPGHQQSGQNPGQKPEDISQKRPGSDRERDEQQDREKRAS